MRELASQYLADGPPPLAEGRAPGKVTTREMLAEYAQVMAHGRQNAFWFVWPDYFTFDSTGNDH